MSWLPKKTVLVPVDFSQASFDALDVAKELVASMEHLHVVHVTQPLHVAEPGILWGTMTDSSRLEMAGKSLTEKLEEKGLASVTLHNRLGLPGQSIAELASEIKADLIVMPSHGRSGLQRLFLGSVTEKVLRMADCPVLVLRVAEEK